MRSLQTNAFMEFRTWHVNCFVTVMIRQPSSWGTRTRAVLYSPFALALLVFAPAANSQVVLDAGPAQLTVEAYANFTAGTASETNASSASADDARFDGGARLRC